MALVRAHLLLPCLQPSLATFSLLLLKLHVLSMLLLGLLRSFLFGFGHFYHFIPVGLCTYSVFLFLFVVSGSGCHGRAEVGGLFSDVDVLVTIRFVFCVATTEIRWEFERLLPSISSLDCPLGLQEAILDNIGHLAFNTLCDVGQRRTILFCFANCWGVGRPACTRDYFVYIHVICTQAYIRTALLHTVHTPFTASITVCLAYRYHPIVITW